MLVKKYVQKNKAALTRFKQAFSGMRSEHSLESALLSILYIGIEVMEYKSANKERIS